LLLALPIQALKVVGDAAGVAGMMLGREKEKRK